MLLKYPTHNERDYRFQLPICVAVQRFWVIASILLPCFMIGRFTPYGHNINAHYCSLSPNSISQEYMNLPSQSRNSNIPGIPSGSVTALAFASTIVEYTVTSFSNSSNVTTLNCPYKYKVLPLMPIVGFLIGANDG